jgi:hypothetical protein
LPSASPARAGSVATQPLLELSLSIPSRPVQETSTAGAAAVVPSVSLAVIDSEAAVVAVVAVVGAHAEASAATVAAPGSAVECNAEPMPHLAIVSNPKRLQPHNQPIGGDNYHIERCHLRSASLTTGADTDTDSDANTDTSAHAILIAVQGKVGGTTTVSGEHGNKNNALEAQNSKAQDKDGATRCERSGNLEHDRKVDGRRLFRPSVLPTGEPTAVPVKATVGLWANAVVAEAATGLHDISNALYKMFVT